MKATTILSLVAVISLTLLQGACAMGCFAICNGSKKLYPRCARLGRNAMVFWEVKGGQITTVVRGRGEGYLAFAWGFERMIGSKAHVVYATSKAHAIHATHKAVEQSYWLGGQTPSQVVPVGTKSKATFKSNILCGSFTESVSNRIKVGRLNFAIWARGGKVKNPRFLGEHSERGILSTKVWSTQFVSILEQIALTVCALGVDNAVLKGYMKFCLSPLMGIGRIVDLRIYWSKSYHLVDSWLTAIPLANSSQCMFFVYPRIELVVVGFIIGPNNCRAQYMNWECSTPLRWCRPPSFCCRFLLSPHYLWTDCNTMIAPN